MFCNLRFDWLFLSHAHSLRAPILMLRDPVNQIVWRRFIEFRQDQTQYEIRYTKSIFNSSLIYCELLFLFMPLSLQLPRHSPAVMFRLNSEPLRLPLTRSDRQSGANILVACRDAGGNRRPGLGSSRDVLASIPCGGARQVIFCGRSFRGILTCWRPASTDRA